MIEQTLTTISPPTCSERKKL